MFTIGWHPLTYRMADNDAEWSSQWLKWRGTQGDAVPHLKYMVECVPPRQVSQRTHGDGNGDAWHNAKVINNWS